VREGAPVTKQANYGYDTNHDTYYDDTNFDTLDVWDECNP
jgi:hypothetical protein